jgi:hypothetical protein
MAILGSPSNIIPLLRFVLAVEQLLILIEDKLVWEEEKFNFRK